MYIFKADLLVLDIISENQNIVFSLLKAINCLQLFIPELWLLVLLPTLIDIFWFYLDDHIIKMV